MDMNKIILLVLFLSFFVLSSCGDDTPDFELKGSTQAVASLDSINIQDTTTAGTPRVVKIPVYALWLCHDAACTDCVLVQDNGDEPVVHDLAQGETLFAGNPPDGEYNCMILKISDTMKFTADKTASDTFTECEEGKEYDFDIYRTTDTSQWKDPDGNVITPHGTPTDPVSDIVYLYVTTDTTAPDASEYQVLELTNTITLPTTLTLFVDFTNKISNSPGVCWLEAPTMGVR